MTAPIVVRGHPTDAELAALTAVLLGRRVAEDEPAPVGPARRWGSARDRLRLPPAPGPGAWRAAIRH